MSVKSLPGRAIYGYDSTNGTWVAIKVDSDGQIHITNTDLTTILSEVQNATYGLEAIKDAIDALSVEAGASAEDIWTYVTRALTDKAGFSISGIKTTLDALNDLALEDIEATTVLAKEASVESAISTTESNIRGSDSDDLKSISDQIDGLGGGAGTATIEKQNQILDGTNDLSGGHSSVTDNLHDVSDQIDTVHGVTDGKVDAVNTDIGDFSSQTNLQSLLSALGIPDVLAKPLYTCLVTDRLDHGTYGLSAIKTLIDTTNAYVDSLETRLTAARAGYLDELDFDLNARLGSPAGASLAADLLTIDNLVDDLEGRLTATRAGYLDELDFGLAEYLEDLRQKATGPSYDQDTDSLEAISEAVAAIETALPSDPADASDIAADLDRHLSFVDFWSVTDDVIAITATADQDYNLPDVTVPTLPTGFTIYRVVLLFKCSLIRDSSAADNGIDEAGLIRIKADGDATFDGNGITAYSIIDNMWLVDVTNVGRDRSGDAFVGSTDLSSKVTGADTYNLRLDSISADGSNLELHDVAVGLRIYFY